MNDLKFAFRQLLKKRKAQNYESDFSNDYDAATVAVDVPAFAHPGAGIVVDAQGNVYTSRRLGLAAEPR